MEKPDHRTRVAAERRERMRRRLFGSALQLVAKQGPAATSIDQVIQAAEVSRGTFYKYFESPEALFDELSLELANEMIRMAEPEVARIEDPAQRVATGMRLVIQMAISSKEVAGFLVRLGWPDVSGRPVLVEFVQRDLEEGMRKGRFSQMPVRLAVNIVSMTVIGAVHLMLAPRQPRDLAAQAVASALRALGMSQKEATRLAAAELPAPGPVDGGLLRAPARRGAKAR
jgi:AcrR family transcriptional regulator